MFRVDELQSDPYRHGHRAGVHQAASRTLARLLANVVLGLVLGFYRVSSFDPFHLLSTQVTYCAGGSFGSGAYSILVTPSKPTFPTDPLMV